MKKGVLKGTFVLTVDCYENIRNLKFKIIGTKKQKEKFNINEAVEAIVGWFNENGKTEELVYEIMRAKMIKEGKLDAGTFKLKQ